MERKRPVNASVRKWDMPQVVYMTLGTYVSTQCGSTQRVALGWVLAVLPEAQGVPGGPLPPRLGPRVLREGSARRRWSLLWRPVCVGLEVWADELS